MATAGLWTVAALPPLAALAWTLSCAVHAPEAATGSSLWDEKAGLRLTLDRMLDFEEGAPRLFLFRLAHVGLLRLPGSDFGRYTWAGWVLATAVWVAVAWLILRSLRLRDSRPGAAGIALLGLWMFSPGFGATWILGERFRVFAPAACFVLGVVLLTGERGGRLRFVAAAVLAQVAMFVDRSGVLVWIALIPVILVFARRRSRTTSGLAVAVWCVIGNVSTAICYPAPASRAGNSGLVHLLVTDPRDAMNHLLGCGADALPDAWPGTRLDQAALGALLIAALLACAGLRLRRGNHREVGARVAPWWAFVLFGAGQAVVLADRVVSGDLPRELAREFGWPLVFLPAGLIGLGSVLTARRLRVARVVTGVILGIALLLDWGAGFAKLDIRHATLVQGEARLVFPAVSGRSILPRDGPPAPDPGASAALRHAGFLRRPRPVRSLALAELPLAPAGSPGGTGRLDAVEIRSDVGAVARGHVTWNGSGRGPDLVLLTRRTDDRPETIIKIACPVLRARSRSAPWSEAFSAAGWHPGDEIRAYGFAYLKRRVSPLDGRFRLEEDGRFRRVEGSGR